MNHGIDPDFHEIDKNRLDVELELQPRFYREHAEKLARVERDLGQAEAALKVARADAELAIRENPQRYGLEKIVEAAVKARTETHKKVRAATDAVIQAKYRVDLLRAAVRTLEHRKTSLENLVELDGRSYFARVTTRPAAERRAERAFKQKRRSDDA